MDDLQITFLEMGGQPAGQTAGQLAAFLAQAQQTIDWAAYDFRLSGAQEQTVVGALHDALNRGVQVRIVYNSEHDSAAVGTGESMPTSGAASFIQSLGVPARPIADPGCLMHQKYVVIDGALPAAQVWTGSTNFTDDSWTLQENNILLLRSAAIAQGYARDFQELWAAGSLLNTGRRDVEPLPLTYKGGPVTTQIHFSPGEGVWINQEVADLISGARQHITVCAAVISSGRILDALNKATHRGVTMDGVYDRTQMEGVFQQWQAVPSNHWKIGVFQHLVAHAHLSGKITTPWSPTSTHDYMHNKILVIDDTVITGSYNFSRNAETNAENLVILASPVVAADYRAFIGHLAQRYAGSGPPQVPAGAVGVEPGQG